MTDPARVYALKYADLEAERDRYMAALGEISDVDWDGPVQGCCSRIADDALGHTNGAPGGRSVCLCGESPPDLFGNREQLVNRDCPVCA